MGSPALFALESEPPTTEDKMSFTLSPDQELAAQTIVARTLAVMCGDATDNVLTLVGNAGTGTSSAD